VHTGAILTTGSRRSASCNRDLRREAAARAGAFRYEERAGALRMTTSRWLVPSESTRRSKRSMTVSDGV
jgi:hypothetical protein